MVLATSYIVGAIPFAQIVARLTSATDLREQGSGTVSASGLKDVAGVGPVVVAGSLDVAKGTGRGRCLPARSNAPPWPLSPVPSRSPVTEQYGGALRRHHKQRTHRG